MKNYIAYYRVSRKEQGISGLGLSAQKSSVEKYVTSQDGIILKDFCIIFSSLKNYLFLLVKVY